MPTITVIVPVYKVEPYIHRCVDSILAQTFTDFELILVDDGSPDNCGAICDEYAAQDSRVRVIHKENGGAASARNVGIDWAFANSDSDWICFVDSDDYFHRQCLELLFSAALEENVGVSMCSYSKTRGEPMEICVDKLHVQKRATEELWCEQRINCTVPWAKIYRKSDFSDVRYPVGVICEDEFTTYQVLFKNDCIAFFNAPLYAYFQSEDSVMRAKWTPRFLAGADAFEQQALYFKENGFTKAYRLSVQNLITNIRNQIVSAREFGEQYAPEIKSYRERCRSCLRRYRRDLPIKQIIKAYMTVRPALYRILVFRRNIVNNGLLYALGHLRRGNASGNPAPK